MKLQLNFILVIFSHLFIFTLLTLCPSTALANHITSSSNRFHQHPHHQQQQQQPCSLKPNICHNGATCVNKPGGGYECMCTNGWEGQNCTVDVDDCSTAACENGAKCHDQIGHFYCECSKGFTGLLCQLEDGCFNNPCKHNSTCDTSPVDGRAICTCSPGFTGADCSIDLDECAVAGSPCEHNGICVNLPGTFKCQCAKGFTGDRCEVNINECEPNPCRNDATCLDERGGFKCFCTPGWTGQHCDIDIDECASNPCQNGGTCKNELNSFRCMCPAGYWGERCQKSSSGPHGLGAGFMGASNSVDGSLVDSAMVSPMNPWAKCASAVACFVAFQDGKCDQECNIPECFYDGYDCVNLNEQQQSPMSPLLPNPWNSITANSNANSNSNSPLQPKTCDEKSDLYCLRNYANGECDQECNSAECGWDGLDCEQASNIVEPGYIPNTQAQGKLVIRVEPAIKIGNNSDSRIELARILRKLSEVTKSILKIESYRDVDEGRGSEIVLIADNRKCLANCYNDTELLAKFLSALKAKAKDFDSSITPGALKMTDIRSQVQSNELADSHTQQQSTTVWVIVCASVATICSVLMVISVGNKKVKEKATIWFPEGFKPVLSTRNRGDPTDRRQQRQSGRNVSTLQAMSGKFFRGIRRGNEKSVSGNPNGSHLHSTDLDRCHTATPNADGGIYHIPYDYDQYSSTYNGTDSLAGHMDNNHHHHHHHQPPLTPTTTMPMNPINMEGPHGLTPLMVASMGQAFSKEPPLGLVTYGTTGEVTDGSSDKNNVTDLLNRGAQLSLASKVTGETALHLAARCGRADNAGRLLTHCDVKDVNARDATGRTPLHAAIAADSLGVFELLIRNRWTDLNAQTHDGTTPLILAAKVGNYPMLEELLSNQADVTKTDSNGKTALHWAAAVNNVDIIRRLLAVRETNKDAQDLAEETPLFLAAREGARGAVEILLSHNANRDIKDQMDMGPVDIARQKKHDDIVGLLDDHEPPTPRSLASLQANSRQISPFSPDSNSNSSSTIVNNNAPPPLPAYHTHSLSNGGTRNVNNNIGPVRSQGGRQAQRAALARSNSTKPLIAEANIVKNNLQSHCKSTMVIKSEEQDQHQDGLGGPLLSASSHNQSAMVASNQTRTLGRRATQSTSSSHQAIQHQSGNMQHLNQFGGALSANNVVTMPATPNSLTNSLSPVSTSMMSPPTHHSLHHLASPTKSNAPININHLPARSQQHLNSNVSSQVPPPSYNDCQTLWSNTNNNVPNMIVNNNNNNIDPQTHGVMSEVYNVPCLKNLMMTPSPDSSPFSLESMASPPGAYNDQQQYQNLRQKGVFI